MRYFTTLCLIGLALTACQQKDEPKAKAPVMKEVVEVLASDSLQGRQTGTIYEEKAAAYIADQMKDIGLSPYGTDRYLQAFHFTPSQDPHASPSFSEVEKKESLTGINVLGYIDNQAENTVVIGAHYDHLGMGISGSLHRDEPAVHNGADDNASGVAVILDLAYKLSVKSAPKSNNYLFAAFSGEEMGLLGSNYMVKNSPVPTDKMNYMINLDMVGRLNDQNQIAVSGVGTSPRFKHTLKTANTAKETVFALSLKESGIGPSDHTSFYLADVPVLHYFTGQHEDYHRPGDDKEKLNYAGMEAISAYIFGLIEELDPVGELPFRKTKNESEAVPRFKVKMGVVHDYLYSGKGLRIDGVSEGNPAQKIGLQKGDIVIKMGDSLVGDMMSYMRILSAYDEGDSAEIWVKRDQDTLVKTIAFTKDE